MRVSLLKSRMKRFSVLPLLKTKWEQQADWRAVQLRPNFPHCTSWSSRTDPRAASEEMTSGLLRRCWLAELKPNHGFNSGVDPAGAKSHNESQTVWSSHTVQVLALCLQPNINIILKTQRPKKEETLVRSDLPSGHQVQFSSLVEEWNHSHSWKQSSSSSSFTSPGNVPYALF